MIKRILDTHVHVWWPLRYPMPWLAKADASLQRPFYWGQYHMATEKYPNLKSLFVECDVDPNFAFLETMNVVRLPQPSGIIAQLPLSGFSSHTRTYLGALQSLGPKIKGVRHVLQDKPYDLWTSNFFIAKIQLLASFEYPFDVCVHPRQLGFVADMVKKCPDVQFVLDHCGKPNPQRYIADEDWWFSKIHELSSFPNVSCKISGLDPDLPYSTSYIRDVLQQFGPDRCLFGSNWPIHDFDQWVLKLQRILKDEKWSENDQDKFWFANGAKCYAVEE